MFVLSTAEIGVGPGQPDAVARVAVIDSGVHAAHPHVQGVAGGIGITDGGRVHDDFVDRLGHGTAVTAVIREKAPTAAIYAIKVFDRQLEATGRALVVAIQQARALDVHLINLSLGTTNPAHESALRVEIAAARAAGIVVVCAAPDTRHRWIPGTLDGVIRVAADNSVPRDACVATLDEQGRVRVAASGYPRPIPGVPPERNLQGVSFAVANVTGLLGRIWPRLPDWCLRAR